MLNKIKNIILKQDFLSFSGNLIYAILGFASFLILTRTFDKELFGKWVLFITTANFIEMFRFGITRTAVVRFLSGAEKTEQKKIMGSNWIISIVISIIVITPVILSNIFFYDKIHNSGFELFFYWYPVYAILNLPFNNALTVLQAKMQFGKILKIRTLNILIFDIFLLINLLYLNVNINLLMLIFLAITSISSLYSLLAGFDGIKYLKYFDKTIINKILNFGKYTTGTLIGSNLLKSADTFIIGLSPFLGTEGVAMYSVPLKLTEVMEIPLRSFAATAFPKMSKESIAGNVNTVKKLFYQYSGALTLLFIPFTIVNLIFADFFVIILGGKQYIDTANIYRIFCIYGLILPLDRFSGVGLDAINKPKENFYKVVFMVLANIIGDFIAVWYFKSLFGVALITIIMTFIGIIVGYYFFNKEINLNFKKIFSEGFLFLKNIKQNL
jgi:O-antigen/teichoic acid export membrane protein